MRVVPESFTRKAGHPSRLQAPAARGYGRPIPALPRSAHALAEIAFRTRTFHVTSACSTSVFHSCFIRGCLLLPLLLAASAAAAGLPHGEPEAAGMDSGHLKRIDEIVAEGLAERRMPGCVVCIGRRGKIVMLKAYGNKQVQPSELPMTTDTVFDMASITKPVATATSIMLLVERGQLKLSQRVSS